jgi:GGDEF domain-containing protein
MVRAMHELAEVTGASIIAEGMESDTDFRAIRDLGIACGQGYFIARPQAEPARRPARHVLDALREGELVVFPNPRAPSGSKPVRSLAVPFCPLAPGDDNDHAYARFENDHDLHVLPVVDAEGTPLGMLSRYALIDRFAKPFRRELYGKKPCTEFMDSTPLVIDHSVTVEEVGRIISRGEKHRMLDGFIVTDGGRYLGVGSSQDLMALITDMQISAARYANPLTALPGAVPLNEHADRLLELRLPFTACYFDINDFKPFNDRFGYRLGDQIIQMLGHLLRDIGEAKRDFVSHIGGDDFMVLFQSEDWEARCARALQSFDGRIANFIPLEELPFGGYLGTDRKGREVMHALPTLAIGALRVEPGDCSSHHEIAAATASAKRMAKRSPGSALFIERRRSGLPSTADAAA